MRFKTPRGLSEEFFSVIDPESIDVEIPVLRLDNFFKGRLRHAFLPS